VLLEKIANICLVEKLRAIQLYEVDFNFNNQFVFGCNAMNKLDSSGYVPEELFSHKGSTAEDTEFDKTLMTDLSWQAQQPMTVISADVAYCYDRVNHKIMSLVWLVLLNGNIPAIVVALICLQTTKFFQQTGFGESKTFFGGPNFTPYMMGLGQRNRAAPSLWIQLSSIMVNVFKQLGRGAFIIDPITSKMIHTMGALFVDDTDLYTWREGITDKIELWHHTLLDLAIRSCLLNESCGHSNPRSASGIHLITYAPMETGHTPTWFLTH
jgi:hypothetical protein